jgi:hypothetical protein
VLPVLPSNWLTINSLFTDTSLFRMRATKTFRSPTVVPVTTMSIAWTYQLVFSVWSLRTVQVAPSSVDKKIFHLHEPASFTLRPAYSQPLNATERQVFRWSCAGWLSMITSEP